MSEKLVWLVYSFEGKVTSLEMSAEAAAKFAEEHESSFDKDTTGEPAWSMYNHRYGYKHAEQCFVGIYMTPDAVEEIVEATDEE